MASLTDVREAYYTLRYRCSITPQEAEDACRVLLQDAVVLEESSYTTLAVCNCRRITSAQRKELFKHVLEQVLKKEKWYVNALAACRHDLGIFKTEIEEVIKNSIQSEDIKRDLLWYFSVYWEE